MTDITLPLDAFEQYFKLTLPKYHELSTTEKGVVLSLVQHYPSKFKYQSVVKEAQKQKPVTQTTTPMPKTKHQVRRRMIRRINMKK